MNARERLAARQAELLRAVLAGGPAPEGFDPDDLRAQRDSLTAKRQRSVFRRIPDLVDLITEPAEAFRRYALANPRRVGMCADIDAAEFRDWLTSRRLLPRAGWRRRMWDRWG